MFSEKYLGKLILHMKNKLKLVGLSFLIVNTVIYYITQLVSRLTHRWRHYRQIQKKFQKYQFGSYSSLSVTTLASKTLGKHYFMYSKKMQLKQTCGLISVIGTYVERSTVWPPPQMVLADCIEKLYGTAGTLKISDDRYSNFSSVFVHEKTLFRVSDALAQIGSKQQRR